MANPNNPYRSVDEEEAIVSNDAPVPITAILEGKYISDFSRKEINGLLGNSFIALFLGLLPILYIFILWWLVQWYLVRIRYPFLASGDPGGYASLAKKFRSANYRLWFAAIGWPIIYVIFVTCRKFI